MQRQYTSNKLKPVGSPTDSVIISLLSARIFSELPAGVMLASRATDLSSV
jgi:hypothetical protein